MKKRYFSRIMIRLGDGLTRLGRYVSGIGSRKFPVDATPTVPPSVSLAPLAEQADEAFKKRQDFDVQQEEVGKLLPETPIFNVKQLTPSEALEMYRRSRSMVVNP